MITLKQIGCHECNGTGKQPAHKQSDNRCIWCGGKGKHMNVPYPMFCLHFSKCAGLGSCPRKYACSE